MVGGKLTRPSEGSWKAQDVATEATKMAPVKRMTADGHILRN
jgi:hypothetical protein